MCKSFDQVIGLRAVRYNQGGAGERTRTPSSIYTTRGQKAHSCAANRYSTTFIKTGTLSTRNTSIMAMNKPATGGPTTPDDADDKNTKKNIEVEVKLRLADADAHAALASVLIPCFKQAHDQENHFFDGAKKELSSQRVVVRVRIYNKDRKAVLTIKGRQVLENGVGTASEEEEELNPVQARNIIADPAALLELDSKLVQKLKEDHKLTALAYLGGFSNYRQEYEWRSQLLELDQTSFPWGTLYELECETAKPDDVKKELEELLQKHTITYQYSSKSKFANFVEKTLE